ncbi:MAG: c-type cytochrome [Planctomycetota bacterium]
MPFRSLARFLLLVGCSLLLVGVAAGQNGDRPGDVQPETWKRFDVPPAPVVPPEEALAGLKVAPGFRVELVAAEPLVEDPVAIAFDPGGRIWAVEMRGFMPNVDGEGEDAPVGQIVVLHDDDGDGRMDRSTVFLADLVLPRALTILSDGVLVAEPTDLWWCRDTDGDFVCDERVSVAKYGSNHPDHLEHTENGLLWGLDNYLYNAKSRRRLSWKHGKIDSHPTLFRGQWGIAQDDLGRLYYNGNSSWLVGDAVPAEYLARNPHAGKAVGQKHPVGQRIVRDESVFTMRVNPGINRGYQKHMLREDGRLARTTCVSGLTIYRGEQFPEEYRGDAFVPESAGNVVGHFRLTSRDFGTDAEHRTVSDETWGQREFLASADERFRPVDCEVGPDGALYVVDFYRGIVQHRMYVTTFLRKQILERGLDRPVGLGRIYRVVYEGKPVPSAPKLEGLAPAEWVPFLEHANGIVRQMAQRLLVEAAEPETLEPLRMLVRKSPSPFARIHAAWTLHGMGERGVERALDFTTVRRLLRHGDPEVRVHGLRVSEQLIGDDLHGTDLLLALMDRARDRSRRVRVQLLFTLGSFPPNSIEANELMLDLVTAHAEDAMVRTAALSGWGGRALGAMGQLIARGAWAADSAGGRAMLKELTRAALRHRAADVSAILSRVEGEGPSWRKQSILDGVLAHLEGGKRKISVTPRPAILDQTSEDAAIGERLAKIAPSITSGPVATPLSVAEQKLFDRGAVVYQVCANCHGPHGEGVPGLAPQLADSSWVTGSEEALMRIVLHGMNGPLVVSGQEWNDTMPAITVEEAFRDDTSIAAVLTYIRRHWGHQADPVSVESVAKVRAATRDRLEPWTVEELQQWLSQ